MQPGNFQQCCPGCGCLLQQEREKESVAETVNEVKPTAPGSKRKIAIVASIMIVVLVVSVLAFQVLLANKEGETRSEYIENLNTIRMTMLDGAADSEGVCNLVYAVWGDTIREEWNVNTYKYTVVDGAFNEDFNDSIGLVYADKTISEALNRITTNREDVVRLYAQLSNPPSDLAICYETVSSMYDAYFNLTSLALSPSGNYNTYAANFGEYDSDFMKYYKKLGLEIPEA